MMTGVRASQGSFKVFIKSEEKRKEKVREGRGEEEGKRQMSGRAGPMRGGKRHDGEIRPNRTRK